MKRILILGGGFAGVYAAMHLESLLGRRDDIEVALVSRQNYFVFQPMLAEVVSGNIGILDTVSPLRRLLRRTRLYVREIEAIDVARREVRLAQGFHPRPLVLPCDHLVVGLGSVTDFRGMPGLPEHAMPFKDLADALHIRNHVLHVLEEADIETDPTLQAELLTFVVAGGGFSGVELIAEMNDFVRRACRTYPNVDPARIRMILLHSGERILDKEMAEPLGMYAQRILQKRGVEIRFGSRLRAATPDRAVLASGERIATRTLVSTVPSSPHPLLETLPLPSERGRLRVTGELRVEGRDDVWALGDCALVPNGADGAACPPTAQHATRQARTLAHNIVAALDGGRPKTFAFPGLGKMGSLGHHSAVAEVLGVKLSGRLAWFLWRTVYFMKLPGLDRKLKLAVSWLLEAILPPDLVQLQMPHPKGVAHAHFEPDETIFRQGELGDCLYMIVAGEVQVTRDDVELARLRAGDYFGEMALLHDRERGATVRAVSAVDALVVRKGDFGALLAGLGDLRTSFEETARRRATPRDRVPARSGT